MNFLQNIKRLVFVTEVVFHEVETFLTIILVNCRHPGQPRLQTIIPYPAGTNRDPKGKGLARNKNPLFKEKSIIL